MIISKKAADIRMEGERMREEEKELEGIRYIREQNDMEDMGTVLALYNKLSEKKLFHTQAGKAFMEEMRNRLLAAPEIDNNEIAGYQQKAVHGNEEEEKAQKVEDRIISKYKYKYYNSLMINIILALALVLGFLITTNAKNVNIINYENKLVDKYQEWEAQLKERESIVAEREKALIQP